MTTWRGQVYVPRIREVDPVPTNLEFEYASDALYYERQSLIDALENWLDRWPQLYGYFDESKKQVIV